MRATELFVAGLTAANHFSAQGEDGKKTLAAFDAGVATALLLGASGAGPTALFYHDVPEAKGREIAHKIIANGRKDARNLTDAILLGPGDVAAWFGAMVSHVLPVHAAAAQAVTGKLTSPGPGWDASVAAALLAQVGYLDRFANGLLGGTIPFGPSAAARAALYATTAWQTAQRAWRGVQRLYHDEERRVLGHVVTHHCHDCPDYAALGWQPAGTLPEIGDSQCQMWCHCYFEFRRKARSSRPAPPPAPAPAPTPFPAPVPVAPQAPALITLEPGERLTGAARRIFGRDLSPEQLAATAGAPAGSTVDIRLDTRLGKGAEQLKINWSLPGTDPATPTAQRTLRAGPSGPIATNDNFQITPGQQQAGHAVDSLGRQISALRAEGASHIETTAVRDDATGRVGYRVWPKFGYDGPIPEAVRINLPGELGKAIHVSDLYKTPQGQAWWETHGDTFDATLDLTPNSPGLARWEAYKAAKATSPISPLSSKRP